MTKNLNMRISYIYKIKLTHSVTPSNTFFKCYIYPSFPEILGMIKTFYKFASQKSPDSPHLNGLIYLEYNACLSYYQLKVLLYL